jgi:acetyltransferase-like isoleucine patch superfamily enzyme
MENIFFDLNKLKHIGKNVIIGKTVRIRHPELVSIGDNSIIDDFTYISAELEIGKFCHVASNSVILGGGGKGKCIFEDLTGCAPGTRIITSSDDYTGSLGGPNIPEEFLEKSNHGLVHIKNYSILGANTVVMPNVTFEEGSVTNALTLVRKSLEPWTIYSGNPARKIGPRDKDRMLETVRKFWKSYNENGEQF